MFVTIVRNPTMYTDAKETAITKIAVWLIFIPILNLFTLFTTRGLVEYDKFCEMSLRKQKIFTTERKLDLNQKKNARSIVIG